MTLAAMLAGCSEDICPGKHPANSGDEVQFGVALPGGGTRTVYGPEGNTGFPIYWVNGDKVKVASPQGAVKTAEYEVSVTGTAQVYADALTKTGNAGIQWGKEETADFYSIYPSEGASLTVKGNTCEAQLNVASTQNTKVKENENNDGYYAEPAEMDNVIMYAMKTGVPRTSEAVDLQYKPYSTVIEFTITAPEKYTAEEKSELTVQALSLTAPNNSIIAGDFTLEFPSSDAGEPVIQPISGGSNSITLHFLENNIYNVKLAPGKRTLKAKMCLMPNQSVKSLAGWDVSLYTSAGTFSTKIKSVTGELKAGKVHQITLPELSYAKGEWTYELNNWITSLPDYKNIYLSEVSLPGAWYAGSTESYQATTDITTMWNAGVRAFAVECRSYTERANNYIGDISAKEPIGVCISGSGDEKNGAYTTYYQAWPPTFREVTRISSIISKIAQSINKNEYGVLVLSYADGGSGGHRALDYQYFIQGIAQEITDAKVSNIYADPITPNTTINDVLSKLIIKVNVDTAIVKSSYTNNMNALLSYTPFLAQVGSKYGYDTPYYSTMYWQKWEDSYKTFSTSGTGVGDFVWCFSSANRTQLDSGEDTSIPHYSDRKTALQSMMNYSKTIYDASTHNVWFYFNAGGTQATSFESKNPSPTNFAATMNKWLLDRINEKTDASPLGLVMFNQCTGDNTTYYGTDIIKAIIEMNSKFYLKHAGDDGGTGGNTGQSEVRSAAPGYSSGAVDNNTNAINWE